MPIVRTTMRPDREIEVGDVEYADLKAQGLLVEDTTIVPSAPAVPAAPSKKASGAAGSKES